MNRILQAAILYFLLVTPLMANQEGVIVREATVYTNPSRSSATVGKIDAGTRVNIFGRKGGWKEIFAEKHELIGWVRSYQVREGELEAAAATGVSSDSRGFLSGLAAFSRKASRFFTPGESATSSGTATIGVRGLSEAELKAASPDPVEFEKMRGFASNPSRLAKFRLEGRLDNNKVAYIKPKKNKTNSGNSDK